MCKIGILMCCGFSAIIAVILMPRSSIASGFEIKSFRQGLVKFDENKKAHIYQEGDKFDYKESGVCIVAGLKKPCLWYAIEFDYKSPEEITAFECLTGW